jgi:hypothetical protein
MTAGLLCYVANNDMEPGSFSCESKVSSSRLVVHRWPPLFAKCLFCALCFNIIYALCKEMGHNVMYNLISRF